MEEVRYTFKQWMALTLRAFPALLTPVILLGGIYTGVVTPTEAGALAGLWALIMSVFVYRAMGAKKLWEILINCVKTTGVVSIIVGASFSFAYIISIEKLPQMFTGFLLDFTGNKYVLLFIINIMFLVLGMLMDVMTITVVFIPIVLPLVTALGIDLVHFGVVVVLNMMIGLSTPPFGGLLFVVSGVSKTPLHEVIKEILPMVLVMIGVLFLITYVPDIVLFLPRLFM